jgi:cysteine desulfurase
MQVRQESNNIGRIRLVNFTPSQATAPVDPRVLDAMLPFMTNQYGNPQSCTHAYGWEAEAAVDKS